MTPPPSQNLLEVSTVDDAVVVKFHGDRLDDSNSRAVSGRLLGLVEQPGGREVRLDLGNVEFIVSTGLGLFVTLHKKLKGVGRHLALLDVNPAVYEVFEVTHLHELLDVRPRATS